MNQSQPASFVPQQPSSFPQRLLVFNGPINLEFSNKLRLMLFQMLSQSAKEITILFSSSGGNVDEGIALYNFLYTFPIPIRMHAAGLVASIAIPVFLAASVRFVSSNARFFFHDFTWTQPSPTRTMILEADMLLKGAFEWTTDIYKDRTQLTDMDISEKNLLKEPYIMRSFEALNYGIAQEEREPCYDFSNFPMIVM